MTDAPDPLATLFAPEGGWRVRILDQSGGAEDRVIEEVAGFASLAQANEFAARYVRDSIERCRTPGADAHDVLEAWLRFGEDAEVVDAAEAGWHSGAAVSGFAAHEAEPEARNWRVLDPRRLADG